MSLLALKTSAQAAGALVTANTAGWTRLNMETVLQVSGTAGLMCVLHHLSDLKIDDPNQGVVDRQAATGVCSN